MSYGKVSHSNHQRCYYPLGHYRGAHLPFGLDEVAEAQGTQFDSVAGSMKLLTALLLVGLIPTASLA